MQSAAFCIVFSTVFETRCSKYIVFSTVLLQRWMRYAAFCIVFSTCFETRCSKNIGFPTDLQRSEAKCMCFSTNCVTQFSNNLISSMQNCTTPTWGARGCLYIRNNDGDMRVCPSPPSAAASASADSGSILGSKSSLE